MSKSLTTQQWIEKARKVHGDKYDYSKVEYVNNHTKVCIICPEHGEFWQTPHVHLDSNGCQKCSINEKFKKYKLSTEQFIEKAREVHGGKYDYSKVEYKDARTDICIICPEHGEFWQKPYYHLSGNGCQKCANIRRKIGRKKKKTTNEFINELKRKYQDKYDYSKVKYTDCKTNICLINNNTKEEIFVSPTILLSKNYKGRTQITSKDFITKAKQIWGNKYDYSITEYINSHTKIKYICNKHGIIEQLPYNHIRYGCKYCSEIKRTEKRRKKIDTFLKDAKLIHGDKYDYSKVKYINCKTPVCIICPEHGEFWQTPLKHLMGHGCQKCKRSHLEEQMAVYLDNVGIKYMEQYTNTFLKNGRGLQKIDFYLPDYNVAIECQGIQHFIKTKYLHFSDVKRNQNRDIMKYNKCNEKGIKILYYTTEDNIKYKDKCFIYNEKNIFSNIKECINEALKID